MPNSVPRTFAADRAAGVLTAPATALRFGADHVKFAAGDGDKRAQVSLLARSGQPIEHWYWGKVVHDMAGFQASKPTLPCDYCHNDAEVLGKLNLFQATNEGLTVSGELISFREGDRAAEVIFKAREGVPYEASISFDPSEMLLEIVYEGFSAQVNGYSLEGPGVIVRKWVLRGVAICPYGYDRHTRAELSAGSQAEVPVQFVSPQEFAMSKATDTKPAEAKPAETTAPTQLSQQPPPTPATPPQPDPRAEFQATLAKFTAKFGAANGAQWAADGLTYEQALEKHAEAQATALSAATKENGELKTKLAAIPRGEAEALSQGDAQGGASEPPHRFKGLGKLSAFAASIKLPAAAK